MIVKEGMKLVVTGECEDSATTNWSKKAGLKKGDIVTAVDVGPSGEFFDVMKDGEYVPFSYHTTWGMFAPVKKKSGVQQTSRLSLFETAKEGKIGKRQKQVLSCFEHNDRLNNRQIAALLGLPINSITPRVKELREMNILVESARVKDIMTNRQTIFWRLA